VDEELLTDELARKRQSNLENQLVSIFSGFSEIIGETEKKVHEIVIQIRRWQADGPAGNIRNARLIELEMKLGVISYQLEWMVDLVNNFLQDALEQDIQAHQEQETDSHVR
jgi:hypothetical protein